MTLKELAAKDSLAIEEAFIRGNLDPFDETHAPDLISHMPPFPKIEGSNAYKQFVIAYRQAFSDIQIDWDETIIEDNTIAHRFTMRMKHTGEYPGIPVPHMGAKVVVKGSAFLHVEDDKIVEVYQYGDWLGILQQIGAVPPIGQK